MSYRKFLDHDGRRWEVRAVSKSDWRFDPLVDNSERPRRVAPPLFAGDDPFELSQEDLRRILDDAKPMPSAPKKSPFKDDYEPEEKTSPFRDS